jgi:hypothetical protein
MSIDFEREDRLHTVTEKAYMEVMKLMCDLSEKERRYFILGVIAKLAQGVGISMRSELMAEDFTKNLNPENRG